MRPIIGITLGDPGSIGPEITAKVFSTPELLRDCRPIVIGDKAPLKQGIALTDKSDSLKINVIQEPEEGLYMPGTIDLIDCKILGNEEIHWGEIRVDYGNAAFKYVKKAIDLALAKKVDAMVTNAISKEAINLAGHHFSGHTEILAHYTGTTNYAMMLGYQNLRVIHVSTHVPLSEAIKLVKKVRIVECIQLADSALRKLSIEDPRIAVAGLNPHASENGMFGTEEAEEIAPAVEQAREMGYNVTGPVPADTIFSKAHGGWYDAVIAMYHDQGHIPMKVLGFVYDQKKGKWNSVEGVNVTLGLPIIRTSVDHGTAPDLAGKGEANELSLRNAIGFAVSLADED
jgi:4-phospho-D-threonate 3-dehydrogenase / 4-phospho-D-erythronate 3-dehydrogenase